MTNLKATRRALLGSVIALILCFSMLLGTTLAWFSDSVTSVNNIIKSGTLDVKLEYNASPDPALGAFKEITSAGEAIYGADVLWEPGYVDVKHFRISNSGNLALKYQIRVVPNILGAQYDLADVIDVYFFGSAQAVTRQTALSDANKLGTLAEVMNSVNAEQQGFGDLKAGESDTITLVLKMQETAGNEYQGLSLGEGFTIQLIATQDTVETDSFDDQYDAGANADTITYPVANVTNKGQQTITDGTVLNTSYEFSVTESAEEVDASPYRNWIADFYVTIDKDVAANTAGLAGQYDAWSADWLAIPIDVDAPAGSSMRLLKDYTQGAVSINYYELCNTVKTFNCGAWVEDGTNSGLTLTVELRLYETYTEEECLELFGYKSTNVETGEYVVIGSYSYTFE